MKGLLNKLYAVLALTLSASAFGGPGADVPLPEIPAAVKGESCVEDTGIMRRNHMDFLKTHRDATMHRGIRTKKYSLKACLDCHVAPAGTQTTDSGEGHFCQNCHAFASVRIDCFECHATRPTDTPSAHTDMNSGTRAEGSDTAEHRESNNMAEADK